MTTASEVPPRVRQLATELAQPQPMRRGSVSERTIKCGKAGCACADSILAKLARCRQTLEQIQPGSTLPKTRKRKSSSFADTTPA